MAGEHLMHDYIPLPPRPSRVGEPLWAVTAVFVCLVAAFTATLYGQNSPAPSPFSADVLAAEIGDADDARTVISAVLRMMPHSTPRPELFLRQQLRPEWLPLNEGVEYVLLTESE